MSDRQVAEALRSDARLVLVEAPAGFGKTFQGAQYAKDLLPHLSPGRLLVLTHTNAACDVFSEHTKGFGGRVEIRTIDSLISCVAAAYHEALGLPSDVYVWAHQQGQNGFNDLAVKVANLLKRAEPICKVLSVRYPYVVCDEHQDTSEPQHQIVLSIHHAGASMRVFADPMQDIYGKPKNAKLRQQHWIDFEATANRHVELETPHRWKDSAPELGEWIKGARSALKHGQPIDLSGELPRGLTLIRADNIAQRHGQYRVNTEERKPIDEFVKAAAELLILASDNDTVHGLRSFFYRAIPVWEGYTREKLSTLILCCQEHNGKAEALTDAFIEFVQGVTCGFSDSAYGNVLRREVCDGCSTSRRHKSALMQEIARLIFQCPDHRGVAQAAAKLDSLIQTEKTFNDIKVDLRREFREAARLAECEDLTTGLAALAARRSVCRPSLPTKAISTIHKAKGLERESILIVPCDQKHFADTDTKRRLLYVALSRATKSLALVVPHNSPSPLFLVSP